MVKDILSVSSPFGNGLSFKTVSGDIKIKEYDLFVLLNKYLAPIIYQSLF